jgi:hypothetical protein
MSICHIRTSYGFIGKLQEAPGGWWDCLGATAGQF